MSKLEHRVIPLPAYRPPLGGILIVIVVIVAIVALTAVGVPQHAVLAEVASVAALGLRVAGRLATSAKAGRRG